MSDDVLKGYRKSIDNIDAALVCLLAERFKITQAVGRHKAGSGLPAADPSREDQQIARLRQLALDAELDAAERASQHAAESAHHWATHSFEKTAAKSLKKSSWSSAYCRDVSK